MAEFSKRGVLDVLGIDGAWVDKKLLTIGIEEFTVHDFGTEKYTPIRKYDLALCIEVAEHISADMGALLIDSIVNSSDVVLFSAAVMGQGGSGHVNEQCQHYWSTQFAERGYICVDLIRPRVWANSNVNVIYKQNMLLYVREPVFQSLKLSADKIISHSYDTDRIHPDLLVIKDAALHRNTLSRVQSGLRLLLRKLGRDPLRDAS